jgi:hypothetical protein
MKPNFYPFGRVATLLIFILLSSLNLHGQIYNYIDNVNGTPATVAINLTGTSLSRVNGTVLASTPCQDGFSTSNYSTSLTFNVNQSAVEFSVTPTAGNQVTVTSLRFNLRRNNQGPDSTKAAYSIDNGATWTYENTSLFVQPGICGNSTQRIWDMTDFTTTNTVKIRFYGFKANNSNGATQLLYVELYGSTSVAPGGPTAPVVTLQPLDQQVCVNNNASFTSTASGTPAPTVQWEYSSDNGGSWFNVPSATSTTLSFTALLADDGNLYRAVFTNGSGSSTSASALLSVNDLPVANAGSDVSVCWGSTITLSGTLGGSATSGTWSTAGDGTFDNASLANAVYTPGTADSTAGSVELTFTADDGPGVCTPNADQMTITFSYVPAIPSELLGDGTVCVGTTGNVFSINPVPGALSYLWTGSSAGVTIIGNSSSVLVDFDSTILLTNSGSFLHVQSINGCGASLPLSRWIRHAISIPQLREPSSLTICPNTTGVYFRIVKIQGATSVIWTAPAGASISSSTDTTAYIDFGPSFTGGNVNVTASHICMTTQKNIPVTPGLARTPGNITGQAFGICNSTLPYSVSAVVGAVSYIWTVPANSSIIGPSNGSGVSVQFGASFSSGVISVKSVNSCGIISTARTLTVYGIPAVPSSITGPTSVCANQNNVNYTAAASAGATSYLWTVPAGAIILNGQGTATISVKFGVNGGSVTVKAVRSCGTSGARALAVAITCREGFFEDVTTAQSISAYPNPANEYVNVQLPEASTNYNISFFDISGRLVQQWTNFSQGEYSLPVTDLSPGMYMMVIENGEMRETIRIAIER